MQRFSPSSEYFTPNWGTPSQGVPRSDRHPLVVPVKLLLDFQPWKLCYFLTSANLSASGLLATYRHESHTDRSKLEELAFLLSSDPSCTLQIEHESTHLFAPVISAVPVRQALRPTGLELAFQFTENNSDLELLLAELSA